MATSLLVDGFRYNLMCLHRRRLSFTVMVQCPRCSAELLDTDQYCGRCGIRLKSSARTPGSAARSSLLRPEADLECESLPWVSKSLAGMGPESAVPTGPREATPIDIPATPTARLVVIRHGQLVREFPLQGTQWLIGRWDPQQRVFPDVDLDDDDPEATVSRRHAYLVYQDGQYLIEDLGSTNGTFINRGHRLIPGRRYVVQDGDEIIVGKTFLKLVIG